MTATPAVEGIMKRLASTPAAWPTWASPAFPRALLLVMNWARLPCPVALVLTIVSKLKPKSSPATEETPAATATTVTDCSTAASPRLSPRPLAPESCADGTAPPTAVVTGAAAPEAASVRKVCTASSPDEFPGRDEVTVLLTTRTEYVAPSARP